jgi:Domain of unknown function (DUF3883)
MKVNEMNVNSRAAAGLEELAVVGHIKALTGPPPHIRYFNTRVGFGALETPREKRPVSSANFWFSFHLPLNVGSETYYPIGKSRNSALPNTELNEGCAAWKYLIKTNDPNSLAELDAIWNYLRSADSSLLECAADPIAIESKRAIYPGSSADPKEIVGKKGIDLVALKQQLDRNDETGKLGENEALVYEKNRLAACGCPTPEDFVEHVAPLDVGRGYDIHSSWPGEERLIEVKSTRGGRSEFYISQRELDVLEKAGPKSFIYRVTLQDGTKSSIEVLQDPINRIGRNSFVPVGWSATWPTKC